MFLGGFLLGCAFDDMGEIADGDGEGKVERGEHDGEENPPSGHGGDKCKSTSGLDVD